MRIKKIQNDDVNCYMNIDFYVPITIEFLENSDGFSELFYYRFLSQNSSMVEITVNAKTEKITRLIVVSINDVVDKIDRKRIEEVQTEALIGNPEIDMECFSGSNVATQKSEIEFKYSDRKIFVLLKNGGCSKIAMGNLTLFMDERMDITGFSVEGFSEEEWNTLKEAVIL